jgi:Fe2+ or Zn2+ uptake regulation protein
MEQGRIRINNPKIQTMQLNFFNTIQLDEPQLTIAESNCTKQEERILKLMQHGKEYTPFEILDLYQKYYAPVPITSIRRAMTCLTDKGKLQKLPFMKHEQFGKPNHTWKLI